MKIQEILKELEFNYGTFPRKAVEAAIANRERITPELLRIIEEAKQNVEEIFYQESYMAHIYAMYLLAQFRERRAYPLIADFFSIPGEISVDVCGDFVTESLGRVLASVSWGDTSLMERLAENENASEWVREAALRAMLTLVARGQKPREETIAYYQSLFRGKLEREYSHVWNGLVSCCTALYPEEVLEDIEQAFDDDLVDEMFIDLEWVRERLALGKARVLKVLEGDRWYRFIEDTVSEMEWWACFQPPKRHHVVNRSTKKVGRNDPCPCGSGKKYKWCCGSRR